MDAAQVTAPRGAAIESFWEEQDMAVAGLVVTLAGFLLSVVSVGVTSATSIRLIIVLVGIAVSLGGILGMINPAYQKNALWKR